jgi:hypothetical protein
MTKITVNFAGDSANQAGHLAVTDEMPALVGSDKQVAWAAEIRAKLAREIAELAAKSANVKFGAVRRTDIEFIAETEAAIANALATMPGADRFTAAVDKIFARTDARWWIDNRKAPPVALIRDNG